ncbi:hypothetical protein EEX84_15410 [Planococcus salinus]|uniref:Acyltransferase 3 domain-containing protein n=2 Tax=Planococcus salinus TaxID=1848460 RepID=A0A3M8P3H4_9BACL|nr:acyltransferase family protein [Planococcus salinus]RNF38247.1 hypothetical protein EEX84_15410 [Planococcus salinus]
MAKRYDYMDWLRVLAIMVVVLVHVVSKILNTEAPDHWQWQLAHAIDSALRWCVPIFFMLSGALLLTKKQIPPIGEFYSRRLGKVLIPLIFWSGVYLAYLVFEQGEDMTLWQMVKRFLVDDVYYHLWFLYVIFGLYLMAPFLRLLVQHMSKRLFEVFLGFWLLFSVFMPLLPKFYGYEPAFYTGMFQPFVGYFMLGAYLVLYPLPKKVLPPLAVLSVIGYLVTYWATNQLTFSQGELDEFFYDHERPNHVVISLFVFALFQHFAGRFKPNGAIRLISAATLGIYVIHPLVQFYVNKLLGINETTIHAAVGIPLSWAIIFVLSLGIIVALQRLPGAKHIVP